MHSFQIHLLGQRTYLGYLVVWLYLPRKYWWRIPIHSWHLGAELCGTGAWGLCSFLPVAFWNVSEDQQTCKERRQSTII